MINKLDKLLENSYYTLQELSQSGLLFGYSVAFLRLLIKNNKLKAINVALKPGKRIIRIQGCDAIDFINKAKQR